MVKVTRKTEETDIVMQLDLDGSGSYQVETGIGFFDHMLELWSKHGFFDLELKVKGDLEVDGHHTVEDTGIVLGQALDKALGARKGLRRYGQVILPMDEVLVLTAVDLGGRPYYDGDLSFSTEKVGQFSVELVPEFFRALTDRAGINLHFKILKSGNTHHVLEACFKSFGRALDQALECEERLAGAPLSTKGSLREENG
ncbi:MAG: imidazoleglycerol-phosphate dehydratase HisB [Halanaerobiaceae bacterium]